MGRSNTRRRFLKTTGVATIGMTAVTGCLGDDGGDDSLGNGDGNGASFELGNREASEEADINLWLSVGGDNLELLQDMAEDFNDDSDTIEVEVTSEGSYSETYNQMLQSIRADQPPEIVHLNAVETHAAWSNDAIIPVSDLIGDQISHEEFVDAAVAYYVYGDDLVGLPFAMSTVTAQYNKTAFEDAGLPAEHEEVPLRTFDEWQESAETLMDEGVVPNGVTWPTLSWFWESFYANMGQVVVNNDNGRAAPAEEAEFDSEAGEQLYSWFSDMHENDQYLFSDSWGDARQALLNEEAAVMIDSSSNLASMSAGAEDAGFEHAVGHVPSFSEDEAHGLIIGGGSLFVPRGVEGPELEAAAEFLLYLAEPEQQAHWHMNTGYYPVSQEAADIAEDQGFYDENPAFQQSFQQLVDTEDIPATQGILALGHREIRNTIDDGVERLLGGQSVDEMLSSTDEDITDILEARLRDDPRGAE